MKNRQTQRKRRQLVMGGVCVFVAAILPGGILRPPAGLQEGRAGSIQAEFVPGEILVKFRPSLFQTAARNVLINHNARIVGHIGRPNVFKLRIAPGRSVEDAVRILRLDSAVQYAEPNPVLRLASVEPRDPYFIYQWGLHNTGQVIGPPELGLPRGIPDADIKADDAWAIERGRNILVGIIDTGIDLGHPDLERRIFAWGPDFIESDDTPNDHHGHGSLVAGIIGADTDNGVGISGICWNAGIVPIRAFDNDAKSDVFTVVEAIYWAAEYGVKVLNMSFGGPDLENNETLRSAIIYAHDEKDIVLVAAAGNEGIDDVWYPAAYADPVVAVSATDYHDVYQTLITTGGAWGSNYGPAVDLAAPGVLILSTWPLRLPRNERPGWEGYAYGGKTSMATAFVSGAAALIRSYRPELTAAQVESVLIHSADDINAALFPGKDIYLGWGRVNLLKSLRSLERLEAPLDAAGVKLAGTGLGRRSVLVLTWEDNPNNAGRDLAHYRVYAREGTTRRLLQETSPEIHGYVLGRLPTETTSTYEIVAVNEAGVESFPAVVVVY